MDFKACMRNREKILMEGALGERLKREYHLQFDEYVGLARMIYNEKGRMGLTTLWQEYRDIAQRYGLPFIATTPTRRANKGSIQESYCPSTIILDNVAFLREIQEESDVEMYVGGLLGCKGDAYTGEGALALKDARTFHKWSIEQFERANVDFLFGGIMPTLQEAMGMAEAISDTKIPYIISFTLESNGRLIDGTPLSDAIEAIDEWVTHQPQCYMTNCIHPEIVYEALSKPFNQNNRVYERFLGVQVNTSNLSYAELDNAVDLKTSDPHELAEEVIKLLEISSIKIFGGCCGTNGEHLEQIARRIGNTY